MLAIFLDQKIRAEGRFDHLLVPNGGFFVVTGTAWKWILNPGLGIEKMMRDFGFVDFEFRWLVDQEMAIYTIVIAAVWQSSGFVMAMFLAGLRSVDDSLVKAAKIDGASAWQSYWHVILPILRPVFFSAVVILSHIAIKSFDLVQALTGGGPGYASDLPANFMYTFAFNRAQMGIGAASAMIMLFGVLAILVPYLYSELRSDRGNFQFSAAAVAIYVCLLIFAVLYLVPLYVMITTSLKDIEEIRQGNLPRIAPYADVICLA